MSIDTQVFSPRGSKVEVEEGLGLAPRFDADGLITAVVTDASDGTVLMVAHMNAEALALTIKTGEAHYWSRSRRALWKKGETSGHLQHVKDLRIDCDQDAVWLAVEQIGAAACHSGRKSCFYRSIPLGEMPSPGLKMKLTEAELTFDPAAVYRNK
jgi:phosphoribosyl-AMP cyclohydrolase